MAPKRRRQYGSGSLFKEGDGWAIRWREPEISPDGSVRRAKRYEALGNISRAEAASILRGKVATGDSKRPTRSRETFNSLASDWLTNVLPMRYKHSTQKNHRHILAKQLIPQFGDRPLCEITTQSLQAWVTELVRKGYAPKTIDHYHDVLSAVLRTAVKFGHLQTNPASGVELPTLKTVRPKWVLTPQQATQLLEKLPPLGRTLAGLAMLSGLRRGELFALRWMDFDESLRCLNVRQAVYEGHFDVPKTSAGLRQVPLSDDAFQLLSSWKAKASRTEPDALIFATVSGKPISPNNVARQIRDTCDALGIQRATWLTFRRTYASWAHETGNSARVVASLMGHAKVDTTLNVYTQVVDGSARVAAERVGAHLARLGQISNRASELTH